ncbi:putative collagen alpha-5 chain [Erysiphe neolycopersici]|uniref:Putative collagen alpha-5 chain n=1 Tax=Erysiphe neolycopersici TaxID=212602 RepID=A0A420I614_9PEZI|nr:putative collagen alpha-5 chain [Erysiphe neolycopersici]
MKSLSFLLSLGLLYDVKGWANEPEPVVWVTVTTDIYTTFYCPCIYSETVELPSSATPEASLPSPVKPPKPPIVPTPVSQIWITVTETVSELTTFCPSSTELVQNSKTYTVTEATTLTITDCPCTISSVVPGTIESYTTSLLTTYYTGSTTITLSGITYPVPSAGSMTIPLVQVSTVLMKSSPKSNYPPQVLSTPIVPIAEKSTINSINTAKTSQPLADVTSGQSPSQPIAMTQASLSPTSALSKQSSKLSSSKVLAPTKSSFSKPSDATPQVTANVAAGIDAGIGAVAAAGFVAVFL